MASAVQSHSVPVASTGDDRPWLLPSNHKLRNLVSISIRNLSFGALPSSQSHGKTIDDGALPNATKSPAKLVALRENMSLEHSRSSSDLRTIAHYDGNVSGSPSTAPFGSPGKDVDTSNGTSKTPRHPHLTRIRRRSTLEWTNATPQKRQERLQTIADERMADVFFSLHVKDVEEPVYISETVERTLNPTFRHIDFSGCGSGTSRLSSLTVRVWTKPGNVERWRLFLDLSVSLRNLQFLGQKLDYTLHSLPQNAVIFQLIDGFYTLYTSLADFKPVQNVSSARAGTSRTLTTSSFDALLRLSKLGDSIQDALTTRDKIARDLQQLFKKHEDAFTERDTVAEAEDRLKTIEFAKLTIHKQLEKAQMQREEKKRSLDVRRKLMAEDLKRREHDTEEMQTARPEFPSIREERNIKSRAIQQQRRRICEDLQMCYSIQPVPQQSLSFTIRGLPLPNSDDLDSQPPDKVAAALGYVAHVIVLLAFYLYQPLPYPVNPRSSSSTIEDPLSLLKTTASVTQSYKDEKSLRTYPLFSKGVPRFRFDYAVFLLNKDIQLLLETAFNVRVLDIRQTLPNLKYLLYVATAGEGELPARKAGGVRGLLRARGEGTPNLSRTGSDASSNSARSGMLWQSGQTNGKAKGAVDSLKKNMGSGKRSG